MECEKKNKLCKKKVGSNSSYILLLVGVLGMFVLIMSQGYHFTNTNRVQKVEQIGREYLLRMESDGYLTQVDQNELISDLLSLGYVRNVSVTAPMVEVGYGEKISLEIEYDLQIKSIGGTELFEFSPDLSTVHKVFAESTTSKH